MKKIYVLALALLFVGAAIGQNSVLYPSGKTLDQKQMTKDKFGKTTTNSKGTDRWYSYSDAMDLVIGGTSEVNGNNLFPDSTIGVVYSGGVFAGTWIHKLGDVFDPTAKYFNDVTLFPGEMALEKQSSYTLDSITMQCAYRRGYKTPGFVDTLIFDVAIIDNPTVAGGYSYFDSTSAVSINLNTKRTKFVDVTYKQSTNSFDMNPHSTFKIPLTDSVANDTTATGWNFISCVPNLTVDSNKIVAVSVSFQPGYVWIPMDTLRSYNYFRFYSYDEGGNFPVYTMGDWNVSYIVDVDVRNNNAGGWNGSYIPSFAYMGGATCTYSYIHHFLYYKCTGISKFYQTSIQENNAAENMLGDAYPNPVSGNSELIIPVNTNDANASLVISNVVGQQVMTINTIQNGKVVVNTSSLNDGLYFYTLHSGKNTTTKRFAVIK